MGGRGYSLFLVPYFLLLSFGLVSLESFRFGFSSTNRQPCLNVRPGRITEAGQYKNQPWLPLPLIPSRATISVALECSDQQRYISSRFVFSYITHSNRHIDQTFFFSQYSLTRYCVTHQKSTTPSLNHRRFGLVDKLLRRKGRNLQLRPASSYCRIMKTSHVLHIQLLVVFVVLRTVTSASWVSRRQFLRMFFLFDRRLLTW
jgi:hypothetical protein